MGPLGLMGNVTKRVLPFSICEYSFWKKKQAVCIFSAKVLSKIIEALHIVDIPEKLLKLLTANSYGIKFCWIDDFV